MKLRSNRFGRWALAAAAALLLAACADDLPQSSLNPAGDRAEQIDALFQPVFWIAVGIFVLVEGALVFALIRFRRRRGDDENPKQVHGNTRLEIIWTIIPALLLAGIAVPTIRTIFDLSARPTGEVLEIGVRAHQWWWEVEYPELNVITANDIHVPVGTPVVITLESEDVIHSFSVPRLAGKQDIIPGRTTELDFTATVAGTFPGQCMEYCGLSHTNMRFAVIADEEEDFDAWVESQRQPAVEPQPETNVAEGKATFENFGTGSCIACHAVEGIEGADSTIGPDLTHFAQRERFGGNTFDVTPENLARWLRNPPAMKEGALMPDYNLTDEQIDALVEYLLSLE